MVKLATMTRKKTNDYPTIIYICGSGHSGSTLLDLVLGSHSYVVSLGEFGQFGRYFRNNELCTCGLRVRSCRFWREVRSRFLESTGNDLFYPPKDYYTSFMLTHRKLEKMPLLGSYLMNAWLFGLFHLRSGRIIRRLMDVWNRLASGLAYNFELFRSIGEVAGKGFVVDSSKTFMRMRALSIWRPDLVRVIYLVRDGRAVAAAQKRKRGGSVKRHAKAWKKNQRVCLRFLRYMDRGAWIQISYDALIENPEKEVSKVCSWLGIPFEETMLSFGDHEHHNLAGNRMRFGGRRINRKPKNWKGVLSEEEILEVERHAGEYYLTLREHLFREDHV